MTLPSQQTLEYLYWEHLALVRALKTTYAFELDYDDDTKTWGYHFHDVVTGVCLYDETAITGLASVVDAMLHAIAQRTDQKGVTTPIRLSLCA